MDSTTKLILIIFIVILSLAGLGLSIYSLLEPCKNEPFSSSPSPSPCANPFPISINCSQRIENSKDYIANENKIMNDQVFPWMITNSGYIEQKMSLPPPTKPAKQLKCSKDKILCKWRPPLINCNDDDCQGASTGISAKLNKGKNAFTSEVLYSLQKFMCKNHGKSIVPVDYTDFTQGWKVASFN